MKNKEMKKPIPVELDDDALDTVSGGTSDDLVVCEDCGKYRRPGLRCSWCDMADGIATCHICGGDVTPEAGCPRCNMSWATYLEETKWLRGLDWE